MATRRPQLDFDVVPLAVADLPAAVELSRAVGWPHRLEDWEFVLGLGHGIAARSGGRLVGTAMWWNYDHGLARVGMVVVDPKIQRAGIGARLMDALMATLDAPAIVLNATEAGEPLYRRLGFQTVGGIVQHQGVPAAAPAVALRAGVGFRALARDDSARLVALDGEALGVRRPAVIEALIGCADGVALAGADGIEGFAFCRRFGRGHVIGPVVAPDENTAQALIAHWTGQHIGGFVRIDVPVTAGLSPWLETLGLARCSGANTMSSGVLPQSGGTARTFALVNQALG